MASESTKQQLPQLPTSIIEFQRRLLDLQRSTTRNALDMADRLAEQRREALERWIDRIPNLPDESRALLETWSAASAQGRERFRSTVEKSFELIDGYFERLVAERRPAEPAG